MDLGEFLVENAVIVIEISLAMQRMGNAIVSDHFMVPSVRIFVLMI